MGREGEAAHAAADDRLEGLSDLLRSVGTRDKDEDGAGPDSQAARGGAVPDTQRPSGLKAPTQDLR